MSEQGARPQGWAEISLSAAGARSGASVAGSRADQRKGLGPMLPRALAWIAVVAATCVLGACDHCGNFPPTSQLGACHGGPPPQ